MVREVCPGGGRRGGGEVGRGRRGRGSLGEGEGVAVLPGRRWLQAGVRGRLCREEEVKGHK